MKKFGLKISLANLLRVFLFGSIAFALFAVVSLTLLIVSITVPLTNEVLTTSLILLGVSIVLLMLDIAALIYIQKSVYHDNLLKTIRDNLRSLSNKKKAVLIHDQDTFISDFKDLNSLLDETIKICDQTVVYNKKSNYREIGIEFVKNSRNVCSYDSLTKKIPDLILGNEMFDLRIDGVLKEIINLEKIDKVEECGKKLVHHIEKEKSTFRITTNYFVLLRDLPSGVEFNDNSKDLKPQTKLILDELDNFERNTTGPNISPTTVQKYFQEGSKKNRPK